jgi:hypothetical protein
LLGSSTLIDLDPSVNTGFNAQPTIRKTAGDLDTARSRKYAISVVVELPADLAGQDGRVESSVTLQYDPNRKRTLTISGTYTALGGNSAFAQYSASIGAYQATVQSAFGGTWEIVTESVTHDDTNKNVQFSRMFREIIFNQGQGILDDPAVVEQQISYSRLVDRPGDSPHSSGKVARLDTIQMQANMFIDKNVTMDLRGKYETGLRQYLIQLAFNTFSSSTGALVAESPQFDFHENKIQVSMTFRMVGSSNILQYTKTVQIAVEEGLTIIPVWEKKLSKHVFQGSANKIRTTTDSEIRLKGSGGGGGFFGGGGAQLQFNGIPAGDIFDQVNNGNFNQAGGGGGGGAGNGGYIVVRTSVSETPALIGTDDRFIEVINRTGVTEEVWVEAPSQGAVVITPVT